MSDARTTGVRVRARPRAHVEPTTQQIEHEIVVTARLLVFWKNQTRDARAAGSDVSTPAKKLGACEEHLERLLATLDVVAVREQRASNEMPLDKSAAR